MTEEEQALLDALDQKHGKPEALNKTLGQQWWELGEEVSLLNELKRYVLNFEDEESILKKIQWINRKGFTERIDRTIKRIDSEREVIERMMQHDI